MPFTPFHFGPSALISLPFNRHIDVPVFVLANVIIDLEPLAVLLFNLPFPVHGFFHSILGALIIGSLWGLLAYRAKKILLWIMKLFFLEYTPKLKTAVISGMLGFIFHVFIDSFMYQNIKPFYPFSWNPLFGIMSANAIYFISILTFIPLFLIYPLIILKKINKKVSHTPPPHEIK